jgi:hypothetical protein
MLREPIPLIGFSLSYHGIRPSPASHSFRKSSSGPQQMIFSPKKMNLVVVLEEKEAKRDYRVSSSKADAEKHHNR